MKNIKHISNTSKCLSYSAPRQSGYTLIEVLVGLLIGLFLSGAAIQSYLSTKETYEITQNVNRIQEDSRFATFFLSRDLRETTNMGCIKAVRNILPNTTNLTDLTVKVGGWDHDDTSLGDEVTLTGNYANSTTRSKWEGLNTGADDELPSNIDSISFSDSLVVKKITPLETAVIATTLDLTEISISGYTPRVGEVLVVGDCFRSDQFEVATVNGTGPFTVTPTGTNDFGVNWGPSARLYSITHTNYHVGLRDGADLPSLFRQDSLPTAPLEELVEGVESMQVLYGLDLSGDGDANRYVSARDLATADWVNLASIRVGFLFVSPGGKDLTASTEGDQEYQVAGGINFVEDGDDPDLRYVANVTVKTRNLGLDTDFSVCLPTETNCNLNGFVEITPATTGTTPDSI